MTEDKILQDELMTEEELDKVAGGNAMETSNDSKFFNSLNGSCGRYNVNSCVSGEYDTEIVSAWANVGIKCNPCSSVDSEGCLSANGANKYYLNGKQITQEAAYQHAMNVTGKQMSRSEWDY